MRGATWGMAVVLGIALAGCGGEREAGDEGTQAEVPAAQAPRTAKPVQKKPAPKPEAAEAVDVDRVAEPERRFEMTQDGEAQTAENFEAWMDEQGIRVADGEQPEAGAAGQKQETVPAEAGEARN